MPTGTMPDPSSPQFASWLQMQDPQTQQVVLRYLGQSQASGNPVSAQGSYAPELSGLAYDLPSMLGGIPQSTNSKGTPNPYNVETAAKYLNYGQDLMGSGGLGSDMLSMVTGPQGSDPSAWKPTRKGTGSPLQFQGQADVDSYASAGGQDWQSYLAQRIASGDTPATAMTKLKRFVQGTDESGGVSLASPDFLASLPSSADFDPVPGEKPLDVKTDRGFASLYSVKDMSSFAGDLFKGVAKDKALQTTAYQDPKTGQFYGGYEEEDTPQMKAAKELGLAFPTQSYSDDDYIKGFQRESSGSDDTFDFANRQGRQAESSAALQAAKGKASEGQDYMDAVMRAYQSANPQPRQLDPAKNFGRPPTTGLGSSPTPQFALPPTTGMGIPSAGALEDPAVMDILSQPFSASGKISPSSPPYQTDLASYATPPEEQLGAMGLPGYSLVPDSGPNGKDKDKGKKTKAPTKVTDLGAAYAMGSAKAPGRAELDAAIKRRTAANKGASEAQQAYYRSKFMNNDEIDRTALAYTMRRLSSEGRTPMGDQLAARSQTLRNLIGY